MRFNEIEEKSYELPLEQIEVAKTIRQNCQPYLQQNPHAVDKYAMYRGIGLQGFTRRDSTVIYKKIRVDDRYVTHSSPYFHKFFNKKFTELYGAPFRNAMFVNGQSAKVAEYGRIYIVFPRGDFNYIWSDEVDDLYIRTLRAANDQFPEGFQDWNLRDAIFGETKLRTELDYIAQTYRSDQLLEGIASGHEIMIRGQAYYGLARSQNGEERLAFDKLLNEIIYG
jgi:hypothetical protein